MRSEYKCGVKLIMWPFLMRTFEFIFQSSFSSGGSSFSRSLKSYRIVSRELSPGFQLFNKFNSLEGQTILTMHRKFMRYQNAKEFKTSLIYNSLLICPYLNKYLPKQLNKLYIRLEILFKSGDALPNNRDEFGNMLLHISRIYIYIHAGRIKSRISKLLILKYPLLY